MLSSMVNRWNAIFCAKREGLADAGLLILRVVLGAFMITHGWGKLTTFSEKAATWADPIGLGPQLSLTLAVFAEFFCSIALILGLGTRFALVPLMITMSVAAFVVHAADPFGKKELALMYLAGYLALFLLGAGRLSLDALISKVLARKAAEGVSAP